jgi:sugar lactone lactonase YvrE
MCRAGTFVRATLLITLVLLALIAVWPFDAAAGQMYWTDFIGGTIERAGLDGTGRQVLVSGLTNPHGIALDLANSQMYWAEYGGHSIRRANLDGTNIVNIVTGLSGNPAGLALDFANHQLYWTDADIRFSAIRRANLDGSSMQTVVNTSSPRDIFLTAGRMYWTDWYTGTLESANLDGTDRRVLRTDLSLPYGLEVDVVRDLIYWADSGRVVSRLVWKRKWRILPVEEVNHQPAACQGGHRRNAPWARVSGSPSGCMRSNRQRLGS